MLIEVETDAGIPGNGETTAVRPAAVALAALEGAARLFHRARVLGGFSRNP